MIWLWPKRHPSKGYFPSLFENKGFFAVRKCAWVAATKGAE
jgi:hypothetical protein